MQRRGPDPVGLRALEHVRESRTASRTGAAPRAPAAPAAPGPARVPCPGRADRGARSPPGRRPTGRAWGSASRARRRSRPPRCRAAPSRTGAPATRTPAARPAAAGRARCAARSAGESRQRVPSAGSLTGLMDLSVVVLSFQNEDTVLEAVDSLLGQDPVPEIVVSHSGGGPTPELLARERPGVRVIATDRRRSCSEARNAGILAAALTVHRVPRGRLPGRAGLGGRSPARSTGPGRPSWPAPSPTPHPTAAAPGRRTCCATSGAFPRPSPRSA